MTALLYRDPGATAFDDRLQLTRLDRVATSRSAADLAEGSTGFPFRRSLSPAGSGQVPARYRSVTWREGNHQDA
ncbi:hypothetical protein ABZ753_00235 [Streptomyces griseoincarnatus]